MNRPNEVSVRVRGGFPIVVKLHWCPAEPDVGYFHPYYEIADVLTERGRSAAFLGLSLDEIETAVEMKL